MESLESIIRKINRANDRITRKSETMAERVAREENNKLNSPVSVFLSSDEEQRARQRHLRDRYKHFISLDDQTQVGSAKSCFNQSGQTITIVYTDKGPIVRKLSRNGKSVVYEGFCCARNFNLKTEHYYYAIAKYMNGSYDGKRGPVKLTGVIREDSGVFHDITSDRAKDLCINVYGSLDQMFKDAMRNAEVEKVDSSQLGFGANNSSLDLDINLDDYDYVM